MQSQSGCSICVLYYGEITDEQYAERVLAGLVAYLSTPFLEPSIFLAEQLGASLFVS